MLSVQSDSEVSKVPGPLSGASRAGVMAQELYHAEFARAGKKAGLQVWRIEKLELVPVPKSAHGDFYVGDAYLVLHTTRACQGFTYRLHFWLGKGGGQSDPDATRSGRGEASVGLRFVGWGKGEGKRGWPGLRPCGAAPLRLAGLLLRTRSCKRGCKRGAQRIQGQSCH